MSSTHPPAKVPSTLSLNSERQPLLSTPSTEQGGFDPQADEESVVPAPDKTETGWKTWTFYGISVILGLAALTLLIKGFIDAGDVDVGFLVWHGSFTDCV